MDFGDLASEILIAVNGPGEVAGWLDPIARTIKQLAPNVRITAAVLPCVFASGAEASVLEAHPSVDRVLGLRQSLQLLWRAASRDQVLHSRNGCVLHLGGEPLLSVLLARRLAWPAFAYTDEETILRGFERVYRARPHASGKLPSDTVVGALIVDAALHRSPNPPSVRKNTTTVGLFPGSRALQVRWLLPLFLRAAELTASSHPRLQWVMARSPFVTEDQIREAFAGSNALMGERVDARLRRVGRHLIIETSSGLEVRVAGAGESLADCDVALNMAGTTTLELASLGIPMVMVLPMQRPDLIPTPGPMGYLHRLPRIGPPLKARLVHRYFSGKKYLSWPNRIAQRAIIPEIRGDVRVEAVAEELCRLLDSDLEPVRAELRSLAGGPGASERLVRDLLHELRLRSRHAAAK